MEFRWGETMRYPSAGEEAFIDSCELNEVTFEETENAIRA